MNSYITHTLSPSCAHYYPGYLNVSKSIEIQTRTVHVPPKTCEAPHTVNIGTVLGMDGLSSQSGLCPWQRVPVTP
jgi:hypothetical protein